MVQKEVLFVVWIRMDVRAFTDNLILGTNCACYKTGLPFPGRLPKRFSFLVWVEKDIHVATHHNLD
jgi:hypothetical protein